MQIITAVEPMTLTPVTGSIFWKRTGFTNRSNLPADRAQASVVESSTKHRRDRNPAVTKGWFSTNSLNSEFQKQAGIDKRKVLKVPRRSATANRVRIRFNRFLCAGGLVVRNQISRIVPKSVSVKPRQFTRNV